jgi:hypothetical protein
MWELCHGTLSAWIWCHDQAPVCIVPRRGRSEGNREETRGCAALRSGFGRWQGFPIGQTALLDWRGFRALRKSRASGSSEKGNRARRRGVAASDAYRPQETGGRQVDHPYVKSMLRTPLGNETAQCTTFARWPCSRVWTFSENASRWRPLILTRRFAKYFRGSFWGAWR